MKRYVCWAAGICVLYAANRFWLIPVTSGVLHNLLAWYGADFLAGALMLCILNILLMAANRPPLCRGRTAALFLFGCGLFWEVITPLYLSRSVGDPLDVLACWLGGMMLYIWDQKKSSA